MTMFFRFDGEAFRILASWNFPSDVQAMLEAKAPTPGHPSALGRAGATLRPAYISDVLADPDYGLKTEQNRALYRATLAVPMLREGRLVGALSLNRSEPGSFTQKHIDLVSTFADQAAIAFENARLFEEVRARTRDLEEALAQQTATADALKVISRSALGLREVMQTLIDSAVRLCADDGVIYLRRGDVFLAEAAYDADEEKIRARNRTPRTPGRGSVTSRVALSGEVEFIPDTLADGEFEVAPDLRLKAIRSLVGVPLLREGQVEGVFILGRREPGRFGARAVELAKTFADQAVIVIENVRLFEEVQTRTRDLEESLAQQTATADVLKVISSSAFDLQKVLDTLTESARRLCGADRATVHMRDGPLMKLRAQAGCSPEFVAYLEATPINPDTGRGQRTHVGMAVRTAAPVEIPDTDASETFRLGEASKLGDFRSIAGVPLLRDGKVEGVFSLARQATGSFTPRQIELLKTFADQAVIAIENARLFDEVQAKTRDLEESLAQQTATADVLKTISRSAFDLDAIFQTLVTTAVDLCKASSGTLCARDGDIFRYRGMAGPEASAELRAYLTQHPLTAPSRSTIAGRVILSGQAEEIHDVLRESGYVVPFASLGSPARALLGVPLLGKTQVQGAIVVARAEPGAFPARQVEILKTFADQAVIAIENSRLFNEVQARTRELEQSLADLRKAQDRLIQSEKLASLGQLTAGIAHEIKNPLNFVNNFASLSRDLLAEMKETLGAAPLSGDARAEVDELTVMLDSNLDKVVHHGKRADSIVKNMLLHSREGSGERARVNVNAMVEEALNLGYHGARAEKPGFNVTIERSLDPDAGEAELYLQEITRVLLNLISNGFYAAAKRKEAEGLDYQPTLTASTRALGRSVEVRIRDNGTGIPDSVREKMFNPFFTTKPAGEGTGLGLSLSHDIVVKQHGGTIEVETEPGHFTEFVITLPREGAKA
jgi:GAF domain-containing protein